MTDEQQEKQFIYIVQCNELNKVKIGRTNNPETRVKSLQTGSPSELHLVATIECDPIRETILHRAFEYVHSHGEWFNTSPEEVLDLAKKLTDNRDVTKKLLSLSTNQLNNLCKAYGTMSVGECFVAALNDKDVLSKIRQTIIHGGRRLGTGGVVDSPTTQIPIRAPHDRREAWNDAAQKAGLTLNAWIVGALDAKLPKKVRDGLAERNNVGRPKKTETKGEAKK